MGVGRVARINTLLCVSHGCFVGGSHSANHGSYTKSVICGRPDTRFTRRRCASRLLLTIVFLSSTAAAAVVIVVVIAVALLLTPFNRDVTAMGLCVDVRCL